MNILTSKNEALAHLPENVKLVEFSLTAFYDCSLAESYLCDFLAEIENHSIVNRDRGTIDYIVIGDLTKPKYSKSEISKMLKSQLFDICESFDLIGYNLGINDYIKAELIESVSSITLHDHYNQQIENKYHHEWDESFTATGYSQGDAIKVLNLGNFQNVGLCDYTRSYIENIFYDQPIYARFEVFVNAKLVDELDFTQHMADLYKYDTSELKVIAEKHLTDSEYKQYALDYLNTNLPKYLECR